MHEGDRKDQFFKSGYIAKSLPPPSLSFYNQPPTVKRANYTLKLEEKD